LLPFAANASTHATTPSAADCVPSVGPGIPPPASVPSGLSGFHAAWYGQSGYSTLCPGGLSTATVAYYNSGTRGWTSGKIGEVAYLGTWEPDPGQDRASPLGGDGTQGSPATGWPRFNRVAVQPAPWVGPNQVAWFQFTVIAPQLPGTYRLSIRPLIEGAQWMEDYGVFWYVTVAGAAPVGSLAPLPAKWPSRALEVGMSDDPGGAAALRATAPFGFRYQYLAGGVNTGAGWTTWAANAQFPTNYIRESANNRLTPVFSYYMIRPSAPGNAMGESDGDLANLRVPVPKKVKGALRAYRTAVAALLAGEKSKCQQIADQWFASSAIPNRRQRFYAGSTQRIQRWCQPPEDRHTCSAASAITFTRTSLYLKCVPGSYSLRFAQSSGASPTGRSAQSGLPHSVPCQSLV